MLDLQVRKETFIKAPAEVVFGIISDLTRHKDLAGSGELVEVRQLTKGPVGLGTMIEANEKITIGDQTMEFAATSVVVNYDAPKSMSWIPVPPVPLRRIQWWHHLTPQSGGTQVVHEVEVDLGDVGRTMFGGTEAYQAGRGVDVANGMDKTLENLKKAAEG